LGDASATGLPHRQSGHCADRLSAGCNSLPAHNRLRQLVVKVHPAGCEAS
jgi:hypothetical protein